MGESQMELFMPDPISDETFEALAFWYGYDVETPLDAVTVESVAFTSDFDVCAATPESTGDRSHIREKIVFSGPQFRVPCQLAIPVGAKQPLPCVLLLDGMGGSKDRWWENDGWPRGQLLLRGLFESGIAVLALDAQYHGERTADNNFEPPWAMMNNDPPRLHRALHMVIGSTVEGRRAIDYLEERTEIDGQRIGVLGQSLGAMMAFALSGIEPRLKAAVACVGPMFSRQRISPVTPHHFAKRNNTTACLMLMGREDQVTNNEESAFLFEQIATTEKKRVVYDSGHRLPPEFVPEAVNWFGKYL